MAKRRPASGTNSWEQDQTVICILSRQEKGPDGLARDHESTACQPLQKTQPHRSNTVFAMKSEKYTVFFAGTLNRATSLSLSLSLSQMETCETHKVEKESDVQIRVSVWSSIRIRSASCFLTYDHQTKQKQTLNNIPSIEKGTDSSSRAPPQSLGHSKWLKIIFTLPYPSTLP